MLKLCIDMDDELLYCGIKKNRSPCSLFVHFLSFKAKFVSQFSQELCKLESSNMVYIYTCRMSDCIVVLRLRVMAFIFLFYPFSFFP